MMVDQVVMLGTLAAVLLFAAEHERRGRVDDEPIDEPPRLTAGGRT